MSRGSEVFEVKGCRGAAALSGSLAHYLHDGDPHQGAVGSMFCFTQEGMLKADITNCGQ